MVAKIIKKNGKYYCSECRMYQGAFLNPNCTFCHLHFSNYEEILLENYMEETNNENDIRNDTI